MKFRMRRKQKLGYKNISESPPVDVLAVERSDKPYEDMAYKERWAVQKGFAFQLAQLSKKHLNDSKRQLALRDSIEEPGIIRNQSQRSTKRTQLDLHKNYGKAQFRKTYRGIPAENIAEGRKDAKHQQHESHGNGADRIGNSGRCATPIPKVQLSGADESSVTLPTFAPHCFLFGDWCPSSLFHDKTEKDESDDNGRCCTSPLNFTSRLIKVSPFVQKSADPKKNGIPKVVIVPLSRTAPAKESGCCAPFGCSQYNSTPPENARRENNLSFDSSIIRLEDTLMKANLKSDIEDKYESPMHEIAHRDAEQLDLTADATTVNSSISTHSSFRIGACVIRLPEKLAPMI